MPYNPGMEKQYKTFAEFHKAYTPVCTRLDKVPFTLPIDWQAGTEPQHAATP